MNNKALCDYPTLIMMYNEAICWQFNGIKSHLEQETSVYLEHQVIVHFIYVIFIEQCKPTTASYSSMILLNLFELTHKSNGGLRA